MTRKARSSGGARRPSLPRVSPTKLNTYLTCPRQYYYGYVRRLPRRARSYYSFGSSLHSALQDFHEQGGTQTQEIGRLLEQFESGWIGAGYETREEEVARFDLGQELLKAYYRAEEEKQSETLFLEKTLSVPQGGFVLTGRIDRIDRRPDGWLEVVDYKSGHYLPTGEELEQDLAIGIYQVLVARKMETNRVFGTIYNLRSNESVTIVREEPDLRQVEAVVSEQFRILSNDTTFEPHPGPQCASCDFVIYCPAAAIPDWQNSSSE